MPSPPSIRSLPLLPCSESAPEPPESVSSPEPPKRVSLPASPSRRLATAAQDLDWRDRCPIPSTELSNRMRILRCAPSVWLTEARTVSMPSFAFSMIRSPACRRCRCRCPSARKACRRRLAVEEVVAGVAGDRVGEAVAGALQGQAAGQGQVLFSTCERQGPADGRFDLDRCRLRRVDDLVARCCRRCRCRCRCHSHPVAALAAIEKVVAGKVRSTRCPRCSKSRSSWSR